MTHMPPTPGVLFKGENKQKVSNHNIERMLEGLLLHVEYAVVIVLVILQL